MDGQTDMGACRPVSCRKVFTHHLHGLHSTFATTYHIYHAVSDVPVSNAKGHQEHEEHDSGSAALPAKCLATPRRDNRVFTSMSAAEKQSLWFACNWNMRMILNDILWPILQVGSRRDDKSCGYLLHAGSDTMTTCRRRARLRARRSRKGNGRARGYRLPWRCHAFIMDRKKKSNHTRVYRAHHPRAAAGPFNRYAT